MGKRVSHYEIKNSDWSLLRREDGFFDWDQVDRAILLDIREALRGILEVQNLLRTRLNCHETMSIPRLLRGIKTNTTKKKRKKP